MPEDSKEKAKLLAAARKKLKEFRVKDKHHEIAEQGLEQVKPSSSTTSLSEKSESELNLNGHGLVTEASNSVAQQCSQALTPQEDTSLQTTDAGATTTTIVALNSSTAAVIAEATPSLSNPQEAYAIAAADAVSSSVGASTPEQTRNLNAIQLLITEKAQIGAELNRCRTLLRAKDLENEELQTLLEANSRHLNEIQQRYAEQKLADDDLRATAVSVQQQLSQTESKNAEQLTHIKELQEELAKVQLQYHHLQEQHKKTCSDMELAQIRISQLSDESSITSDTRVEALTQTQFMYEQQIRDLQAMVQQLSQDKEQASVQYQNYTQHLNAQLSTLAEKNAEIFEENAKLREREQQLVQHVSSLEREIQRNIAMREQQQKEEHSKQKPTSLTDSEQNESEEALAELKAKIDDLQLERYEFQLKIKSQENRLESYIKDAQQKQQLIEELQEQLHNIHSQQPDQSRLLAAMESDKIAASRAVTQNVVLKQQLSELEDRFVQLTNDKADLINRLDAEEYRNRDMRSTYAQLEEKLQSIDERFKYKDDEMIRLSHENMDLTQKNLILQQQVGRLQHYEVQRSAEDSEIAAAETKLNTTDTEGSTELNEAANLPHKEADVCDHSHNTYGEGHSHTPNPIDMQHVSDSESFPPDCKVAHRCQEATEQLGMQQMDQIAAIGVPIEPAAAPPAVLPTKEAIERLQQRFTQLMAQIADLTDEKQRLEHLVLQLQSETETIGEYVTLYQTQRRMLKQREYEKAAQMQLLQQERAQMQEKINILNNLVSSLGAAELPNNVPHPSTLSADYTNTPTSEHEQQQQQPNNEQTPLLKVSSHLEQLPPNETEEILSKIQHIISEIRENTKGIPNRTTSVDHLNCCLGKFEIV